MWFNKAAHIFFSNKKSMFDSLMLSYMVLITHHSSLITHPPAIEPAAINPLVQAC